MEVCKEMQKLREWLDKEHIAWIDLSDDFSEPMKESQLEKDKEIEDRFANFWIVRTHFQIGNKIVSVINGYGTYGGYSIFEEKKLRIT